MYVIEKSTLVQALAAVGNGGYAGLSALRLARVYTQDGEVYVSTNDLTVAARTPLLATWQASGAASTFDLAVSAAELSRSVKALRTSHVAVVSTGAALEVGEWTNPTTVQVAAKATEQAQLPEVTATRQVGAVVRVDGSLLRGLLESVAVARGGPSTVGMTTAVQMEVTPADGLRLTATDGHRLHSRCIPADLNGDGFEALLPSDAIKPLLVSLKTVRYGEQVTLQRTTSAPAESEKPKGKRGKKAVAVDDDDSGPSECVLVTLPRGEQRTINVRAHDVFPQWRGVLRDEHDLLLRVRTAELAAALTQVNTLGAGAQVEMRLLPASGERHEMELVGTQAARVAEDGGRTLKARVRCAATTRGRALKASEPFVFFCNPSLFLQALLNVQASEVMIGFEVKGGVRMADGDVHTTKPAVLWGTSPQRALSLVMPLRSDKARTVEPPQIAETATPAETDEEPEAREA